MPSAVVWGRLRLRNWRVGFVLLAVLQRTNVGDDGPPILRWYLRRVTRHRAPAVCHYIEEVSDRRLAQPIVMIRGRTTKSSADNHSVAVAGQPMTNGAEDLVTFFPASQHLVSNGKRKCIDCVGIRDGVLSRRCAGRRTDLWSLGTRINALSVFLSREKLTIGSKKPPGHGVWNWLPRRESIAKETR